MATIPTILRGEDTAARGRTLAINLPEGDYTGLTIRLQWCGLERSWESPASGASLRFDFSAADTLPIPLGTHLGRLGVVLADGTGYIISEDIRIRVTDDVAEATGEANAINISPADAAQSLEIDLDGIEDEPATPDALRAAWKELLARLRAAVGVALVCVGLAATARAEGRVEVQTAASGSVPWGVQVVTNVTIEGEMGLDGGAVTGIVERIVADKADVLHREGPALVSGNYITNNVWANLYGSIWVDSWGNITCIGDAPGTLADQLSTYAPSASLGSAAFKDASEFATAADEALVYQLLMGSNVVAEVTNYNSRTRSPQLRLLQLDQDTKEYFTVWAETNGLTRILNEAKAHTDATTNALALAKADRAWSHHTSGLGAEAPAGVTWISTPETIVAGGYEYAKQVTTHGEVWVLTSNGMGFGGDSNSYFRVSTPDGETLFSIEKTDEQIIGVQTDGISVSAGTVTLNVGVVTYNGQAPICMAAQSVNGPWADLSEGRPAWISSVATNGVNGAWSFELESTSPAAFFYFMVKQPGATVIKNSAQTDFSGGILVEGTRFYPHKSGSTLTWTTTP